ALLRRRRHRRAARRDRGAAPRASRRAALRVRRACPPRIALLPELRPFDGRGREERRDDRRARAGRQRRVTETVAGRLRPVEATCPRCGAERAPEQRYCVDCGDALPPATARVAALRRRWLRRFAWYPGDWVWLALAALLVAAAGAAAAVAVAHHRRGGGTQ